MTDTKEGSLLWIINFSIKKSKGSGVNIVNIEMKHKEQLVEELHKLIIRNFRKKNSLFWI